MFKFFGLASIVAGVLSVGQAHAQGRDWSGAYVGGSLGYGELNYSGVFDGDGTIPPSASGGYAEDLDINSASFGLYGGYNWQSDRIVYGIEVSANVFDGEDLTEERNMSGRDFIAGEFDWTASLRGRVGYAQHNTLAYVTGGVVWAGAEYTAIEGAEASSDRGTIDFDDAGAVVGLGVEHAVTDQIILRLEGLAYFFDDYVDGSGLNSDSDPGDFGRLDDGYAFRVGATYFFN